MIRDFRSYANGAQIQADICIVGAGAAGIALAREFIGSRMRILLLESGGFEQEAKTDLLKQGESIGLTHQGLHEGRSRSFGGTTKLWIGQCMRLEDIDFEARDWVPYSGWPIRRADLDTFYARAEEFLGISGAVYDERVWRRFKIPPPHFDSTKLAHRIAVVSPHADKGRLYQDEFKNSSNVQVLLHANATKIHTNKYASAVKHLDIRTYEGKAGRVTAKAFVLCGGGIENARLLLLSHQIEPNGIGNRHDVVGRFFQEHPIVNPAMLQSESRLLRVPYQPYGILRKGGFRYAPRTTLSVEAQRKQRVLGCAANLDYQWAPDSGIAALGEIYTAFKERRWSKVLVRKSAPIIKDLDKVLVTVYRRYAQGKLTPSSPSQARLHMYLEQAPNPLSRVYLSQKRDALGLNQARVDWRLTDLERRTAEIMTKTMEAEFRRLGLAQLRVSDWVVKGSEDWADNFKDAYHHIGTTRMASDPKSGVVDSNCQVHGVAGLYIGGSSVFPTSGYAHPTLTIVALALRLADHLRVTAPD